VGAASPVGLEVAAVAASTRSPACLSVVVAPVDVVVRVAAFLAAAFPVAARPDAVAQPLRRDVACLRPHRAVSAAVAAVCSNVIGG